MSAKSDAAGLAQVRDWPRDVIFHRTADLQSERESDKYFAASLAIYLFPSGGVSTSWPSFTGICGPGLNDVRTTFCWPSRR